MKFAEATRGYTQAHQDQLDVFLKSVHLVYDPNDDTAPQFSTGCVVVISPTIT